MKKVKAKRDFTFGATAIKKGDVVEVPKESADIFANNDLVEDTDDDVTLTPQGQPDVDEKKVTVEILKPFGFKGIGLTPGDKIEVLERVAFSWSGDGLAKKVKPKKPPLTDEQKAAKKAAKKAAADKKKQTPPKDKMVKGSEKDK